jgi:hypothetical protein
MARIEYQLSTGWFAAVITDDTDDCTDARGIANGGALGFLFFA